MASAHQHTSVYYVYHTVPVMILNIALVKIHVAAEEGWT